MKLERRRGDGEFFQEAAFHGHGDLRIEKVRRMGVREKFGNYAGGKQLYKFMTRIYRPPLSFGECLRLKGDHRS